MQPLKTLIQSYFPDEKIQKVIKVKLNDKYLLNKTGEFLMRNDYISLGESVYSDFIVTMIETDKKIYFDRRGFPKNTWVKLLKNPVVSLFYLIVILFNIYLFISFSAPLKILTILAYSLLMLSIVKMYASLSQITVFDKSWIKNKRIEDNKTFFEGEIPKEGIITPQGWSFVLFVSKDKYPRLPLIDKFFSGKLPLISLLIKIQQKIPQAITRNFIILYEEV